MTYWLYKELASVKRRNTAMINFLEMAIPLIYLYSTNFSLFTKLSVQTICPLQNIHGIT